MNYVNHDKTYFQHSISSDNFFVSFFTYTKMSKDSSAKFIKIIKKDYKKKLAKDIIVFVKKKKKKSDNIEMNDTKIYQKMKNKNLLSIEKKIIK